MGRKTGALTPSSASAPLCRVPDYAEYFEHGVGANGVYPRAVGIILPPFQDSRRWKEGNMECLRKYSWSLRREPVGPRAPYIAGFMGRLSVLGYAETSVHQYTRLAADFSGWLKQKKVVKGEIGPEH